MPRIVSISGTSRPGNYTSMALAVVNDELEREDAAVDLFDARELSLGFPGRGGTGDAGRLRDAVRDAAAVVLATPEYHGGYAAMTKLIIENLGFPSALSGKPISLLGVAAGRIGAIKSLEQLRGVCSHVGGIVLPGSVSIARVRSAFDEDGACTDDAVEETLRSVAGTLLEFIEDYVRPKRVLEAMVRSEEGPPWVSTV